MAAAVDAAIIESINFLFFIIAVPPSVLKDGVANEVVTRKIRLFDFFIVFFLFSLAYGLGYFEERSISEWKAAAVCFRL